MGKNAEIDPSAKVHPTAVIAAGATIGPAVEVGPYAVIGEHVVVGAGCWIGPHTVVEGHTTLGAGNQVFQFASVGSRPQDLKYHGEASTLVIGAKNLIREYVTLQPGTEGGGMSTTIGDGNLFMANCHVGHDCHVGSGNVFANSSALAGHVTVGNFVTIGGLAGIHQFVRVGDYSLLGGGAMVVKDIPPYCIAQGDRAGLVGLNTVGLERRGFSQETVQRIKKLFRDIFYGDGTFSDRITQAEAAVVGFPEGVAFVRFIKESDRGVTLVRSE